MSIIHITFSFLFLFTFYFQNVSAVSTRHLCHPEQRDALLQFKNEFEIRKPSSSCYNKDGDRANPYPKTDSWRNSSDCCYWDGIVCDTKTGKVIELDLSCSCLHGRFHSNSTLFRLQNLRFLYLLYNDLYGQIPSSFENLSHLTFLDFSENQFTGQIPSSIGNLSSLTSLDLSYNQFSGEIPSSIGKLTHVTSLYFSNNQFTGQIPFSIGNLSSLTSLDLSYNQFAGQIPSPIRNLSHLESLNLYSNNFGGEIPFFLGSLNRLTFFVVASNKFNGNFPIALLNLTNLKYLLLSNNQFTGTIPPNISSLSNLVQFWASDNIFVGALPFSLFTIPSLISLDVKNNQLSGILEVGNISSPSKLAELYLGYNNFRGPIPRFISDLVNIVRLDLSHWNTQGPVDISIFSHLKSIYYLRLSYLNTSTSIDLNAILSFSKSLDILDLSGNHVLATNKSLVSDPPSHFPSNLNLSSCSITEFPELLRTQQHMAIFDISNNNIKGQVPGWLWTLPNLYYVDLSNNTFVGFKRLTKLGPSSVLMHLFGSKNSFTGKIPSFICELGYLRTLDLSDNNINGSIPLCLENLKTNLSVLNLRQNNLSGALPGYAFDKLRSLDIGHNQLVGKFPRSLMNFSKLEVLNVESNRINDTFPFWLSSLQNLKVLVLRSNSFHGPIHQVSFHKLKIIDISHNHFSGILPSNYFLNWSNMSSPGTNEDRSAAKYMGDSYYQDSIVLMNKGVEMKMVRILTIYTALDFSRNRLEGEIPRSIGLLKELHVLNLSSNAFTGYIPSSMGNLTALESLDVSQNKLSGEIPQELGNLSFLAYMNFSHNQLSGLIPGGTQFRTQPCSSFENNSGLFSPVLDEGCRDLETPSPQQYETPEAEEEDEEVFSWIAAAVGLIPGIAFGLTTGYIFGSYKPKLFTSLFGRNKRRSRSTSTY